MIAENLATAKNKINPKLESIALNWSQVSQNFGPVQALKNLSATVTNGSITALLGQNGAGKTTLIDITLGITRAASGSTTIFGLDPQIAVAQGLVGCMLQNSWLPSHLTSKQLLEALNSGVSQPLSPELLLETVNLQGALANRKIGKLSGGERQRLRLALALLANPPLLILDEPTAGMDVNARREFWRLMQGLAQQGRTIFFATHYLAEVENFAQEVLVIDKGQEILRGTVTEMRAQAQAHLNFTLASSAQTELLTQIKQLRTGNAIEITTDRDSISLRGSGLDSILRLVANYPGTANYQLVPASLDEAFTQLTQGGKNGE